MTLAFIANEDLLITFSSNTGQTPTGPIGITNPGVTATVSTKNFANNKGICTTTLVLVFAIAGKPCPHTFAGHTFVSGGGAIVASALKVLADNVPVMREGDESGIGTIPPGLGCVGSWTNNGTGLPVPCQCDIEVSSAGQVKVQAQ